MHLELTRLKLSELVERALTIQEPLVKRKNLLVELSLSQELELIVDSQLLERLFANLLGNAIKFTPENGKIKIVVEDLPEKVKVEIADTGPGIPGEYLEKIFNKFQQLQSTKGGTGLGLTICKYIVEAHGGQIWVESKLGEGSKFIFWLPKIPIPVSADEA